MTARAKTRRSPGLTRRRILEAALALVDRDGADALTMRRLAGELDVAAMSLYKHVNGRNALLDGLAEVMVESIGVRPGGTDPLNTLRRFARGIRRAATTHPAAFQLVGMRPLTTAGALGQVEVALAALRAHGLSATDSVHAYRALVSYARGFALAEIAGFTLESRSGGPHPPEPETLPADRFPTVAELAAPLGRGSLTAAFEFGLEALLSGLERSRH